MVAPPTIWEVSLTGRTRHRQGWFGKLVLQVEEKHQRVRLLAPGRKSHGSSWLYWRDARFDDLSKIEDLLHPGRPNQPPRNP